MRRLGLMLGKVTSHVTDAVERTNVTSDCRWNAVMGKSWMAGWVSHG